jgi:hypothetical protein
VCAKNGKIALAVVSFFDVLLVLLLLGPLLFGSACMTSALISELSVSGELNMNCRRTLMCEEQLTFCCFVEGFCETADGGAIRSAVTHRTGQPGQPSQSWGGSRVWEKSRGKKKK